MIAPLFLLTFAASPSAAPLTSARAPEAQETSAQTAEAQQEVAGNAPAFEWFEGSFGELMKQAKAEGRPVFLHFWAQWSRRTQLLYGKVYQTDAAKDALAGYLGYTIDVTSPEGKPLAQRFNAAKPPRMIFLTPEGEIVDVIGDISNPNWMTTEEFVAEAQRINAGVNTIPALEAQVAETPDDVMVRFELALRLRTAGREPGFLKQVARIRELDPEGTSLPLRTLELERIIETVSNHKMAEAMKAQAAAELEAFIEGEDDPGLLFDAWRTLGTYHSQVAMFAKRRYDHDKAREIAPQYVHCWRKALPFATEAELAQMGPYVSITIFEFRDYVKQPDKEFALEITTGLIEKQADDVDLMDAHACALYMNGKPDEAIALLRRARTMDPSNWILQERIKAFQQ